MGVISGTCTEDDTFCLYVYDTQGWQIECDPPLGSCRIQPTGTFHWEDVCISVPDTVEDGAMDTVFAILSYCCGDSTCCPVCGDCENPNWYAGTPLYSMDTLYLRVSTVTDAGDIPPIPRDYSLNQNYPNPFNPLTVIHYDLPVDCNVRLEIFNVLGQKVATVVDGFQTAGFKSCAWDGIGTRGTRVSSGVYFYRLTAGDFVQTKKMVLLR
jgi:hypothetical protein